LLEVSIEATNKSLILSSLLYQSRVWPNGRRQTVFQYNTSICS